MSFIRGMVLETTDSSKEWHNVAPVLRESVVCQFANERNMISLYVKNFEVPILPNGVTEQKHLLVTL